MELHDAGLPAAGGPAIRRLLEVALRQLGTQVVFLSSVAQGRRTVQLAVGEHPSIRSGWSDPLDDTYCQRIVDGRLPEVVPDARHDPRTADLPATQTLSIGSYLGVPVALSDGQLYGTLCSLHPLPDAALGVKDVRVLRVVAHAVAELLESAEAELGVQRRLARRVRSLLAAGDPVMVLQPVVRLRDREVVACEALSRFPSDDEHTTVEVFVLAEAAGLGLELELLAAQRACALLAGAELPVSINGSPALWTGPQGASVLDAAPLDRLIVEITERHAVQNYPALVAALAPYRARGMRVAVDDVGAGFAGLQHLLALRPDLIKLDALLVRGIDADRDKEAMVAALVAYAQRTGAAVVAEGIEHQAEVDALVRLDVELGQGTLLGGPHPPP